MAIPFLDLYAQYQSIKPEIDAVFHDVIKTSSYIGGKYVSAFEEDFAGYLGKKHVVSCANGTDSLEIILNAWNIGPGDEVIVPAMTWISTAEAVSNCGARPVFVDIDPNFYTMDPGDIIRKISSSTKVIIPVHLYGQCCNMKTIMQIARDHNLKVLEDCAQAHGAKIGSSLSGSWGDAASFSFYPGKNLGAYGDGGCIATDDSALAETCRIIANHGQKGKHHHLVSGRNSRLDGLQAGVLSVKLRYLDSWNHRRNEIGIHYNRCIDNKKFKVPSIAPDSFHTFHIYSLGCYENREAIIKKLKQNNVESSIHYPNSLTSTPVYQSSGSFTESDKVAARNLSLPIYPELATTHIDKVVEILNTI